MSQEETHDLEKLGAEWAQAVAKDLTGLLGIEVSFSGPSIRHAERNDLLPESGAIVSSRCEVDEEDGAPIWIVLSLRGAQVIAAAKSGKTPEEFTDFESTPFEGEVEQAHAGAIDVCAGILGRVLDEEAGLPAIRLGETTALELPDCDDSLPAETYRCASFEFEAEGFPAERFDLLFEEDLALRWFGLAEKVASGDGSGTLDLNIAIIDPCEESRDEFANIAQELGAQVVSLDPQDLGPDFHEELAEVAWVVMTWDLGGRSALDLLERLRSDAATSHLTFAVASPAPTRPLVEAALRWGARTVLYQPWKPDEICERLTEPT